MVSETINLALPKGDILGPVADLLERLQFPVTEYHSKNRTYRPGLELPGVRAKIMAEKDVALQVAVGNYDIGFCGLDWVREHQTKYQATELYTYHEALIDRQLGLYVCSGRNGAIRTLEDLTTRPGYITLVSEYPEIARDFAIRNSLRKYKIFSAWGSVEGYPPEHADAVLLTADSEETLEKMGLQPLHLAFRIAISLVVNKSSVTSKNLSPVLDYFTNLQQEQ